MPDSLTLFGTTYSNVAGFKAAASSSTVLTYIRPQGLLEVTENSSSIDVTQYATVSVNVEGGGTINLQDKTNIDPTTSSQTITADDNYDGLNSVQINAIPSQYIIPAGTSVITANGTGINIAAYASVDVAVPATSPSLQAKSNIAPTESSQTITADTGYYGLSSVQINAISSTYVGSGIATRSDSDLTLDKGGLEVYLTVPSGYYTTDGKKYIDYVLLGSTYYPSSNDRYISADYYIYNSQIIKAVTTSNITAANIKTGVTIQVGDTSNAGRLINVTGTFTSDATASAADILSSKTAYVNGSKITGSLIISTYYTGSGTPSAGLGTDGDIYFQTT